MSIREIPVALSDNIKHIKQSPTLAINQQVRQLRQKGRKIYSFGIGQSPFPVPPGVIQALQNSAHEKDYLDVQGLYDLREAVSGFHQREHNITYDPEDIVIGPGSKELMFLVQMCFSGKIIIPSPAWVTYEPQALISNKKAERLLTLQSDRWHLMADSLKRFCLSQDDVYASKLLIINYPSNPCGTTYQTEELQRLSEVARKYNVIVVSDEIYGMLAYDGRHQSIAQYYPEGTIVTSGLSKWCGAGGWRLGTSCFPKQLSWLKDAVVSVASETFSSVSSPIQCAAIYAYQGDHEIETYLNHSRKILKALADWIYHKLNSAEVIVERPVGGFYILPDFRKYKKELGKRNIHNSVQLCEAILNEIGLAALPGTSFGLPAEALILRLSFVDFDGSQALNLSMAGNVHVDEQFLKENCQNVVDGICELIDWLER